MDLTFGADFEGFISSKTVNKVIPVCGRLGGTKQSPIQFPGHPEGFKYQEDGVTAEFNIPVAATPAEWRHNIRAVMALGKNLIHEKFGIDHSLYWASGVQFSAEDLAPFPQANSIGCDPDFQAYLNGAERPVPNIEDFDGWRFAGFHIHVGYDHGKLPQWMMALVMDYFLHGEYDHSHARRYPYYPKGIFRPKPYGVEYRSLGSGVLRDGGRAYLDQVTERLGEIQMRLREDFNRTVDHALQEVPNTLMDDPYVQGLTPAQVMEDRLIRQEQEDLTMPRRRRR